MIKLSPQAHDVIKSCTLDEQNCIRITEGILDRGLYLEVASAFKNIGGRYQRSIDAFVFDRSFHASFSKLQETGTFNKKEALDFYATPNSAAEYLINNLPLFQMQHNYQAFKLRQDPGLPFKVLEPSAGHGALVDAFVARFKKEFPSNPLWIDCVEIDPVNAGVLKSKGYSVTEGDFLACVPDHPYDLVLMNPPFSLKGQKDCYVEHVNHALYMLSPEGDLAAIVPKSLLDAADEKRVSLLERIVRSKGAVDVDGPFNKKDTFRESGANVSTIGLYLTKEAHPDFLPPIDLHGFEVELMHGALSDEFVRLQRNIASLGPASAQLTAKEFEQKASFILDGARKGVFVDRKNPTPFFKIVAQCCDLDSRTMYQETKKDKQIQFNF